MTETKLNYSKLMIAIQNGDGKAYETLLNGIGPVIFRIVRRYVGNDHQAEEVYQTVLLTLHKARHTYDPERPFQPWVYSIARNTVFDYLRKYKRRRETETLFNEDFEFQAEIDTECEEKEILHNALNVLPEKQKQAVILLKIEGLSIQEAAKKVGVSVAAMKVRAHRGYEILRKELTGNND